MQVSVLLARTALASNAMTKIVLTLILIIIYFCTRINPRFAQSDEFKKIFGLKKIQMGFEAPQEV
jgi:hypothetical protein